MAVISTSCTQTVNSVKGKDHAESFIRIAQDWKAKSGKSCACLRKKAHSRRSIEYCGSKAAACWIAAFPPK